MEDNTQNAAPAPSEEELKIKAELFDLIEAQARHQGQIDLLQRERDKKYAELNRIREAAALRNKPDSDAK
jgi:hypothetical protein